MTTSPVAPRPPATGRRTSLPWRRVSSALKPYAMALAIVALTTASAEFIYRVFNTTHLSMVFLLGVLVTAVTQGALPAYLAATAAFFIYNFYLVEPRFTIRFASPEDVIILFVFFAAAVLTGRLAGQLRDGATKLKARAQAADALFRASRDLSSIAGEDDLRRKLVGHVAGAVAGEGVAIDSRGAWFAAAGQVEAIRTEDACLMREPGWRQVQLGEAAHALGFVGWRPGVDSGATAIDNRSLQILIDLGAAALIRARLTAAQSEMAAVARTERLRTALLSSISHDLRTPLAAIRASSSSLRDYADRFDPAVRADLVLTIDEEAERLDRYVANLLNMTRLESGVLTVDHGPVGVRETIGEVVKLFARRAGDHVIDWTPGEEALTVAGDRVLLEQALGNIVDNALKFSAPDAPVEILARTVGDRAEIVVADLGPGVPEPELDRLFERFYRSPSTPPHLHGSGLGLSIVKGMAEAMGGGVRAGPRGDGRPGLEVAISLPLARAPTVEAA